MLRGIDVSEHQGIIDWNKVKNEINFVMLRVGFGSDMTSQDDKQFARNIKECSRLGIPFGVYLYSYANNISKAQSEAKHVLRLIRGYKLKYPVYLDLEDNTVGNCGGKLIADMAETFCSIIEKAGYFAGIYANTYWFNNKLNDTRFNKWVKWVAQYGPRCTYAKPYDIWQYSSTGKINGIYGNVDMNYCYKDYPQMINNKNIKKQEEFIMDKIVLYFGDADLFGAVIVSQKNHCPLMSVKDYKNSNIKAEKIIKIGGKKGSTRWSTFKDAARLL